mmetsp:Transcript_30166/g.68132  ORF Transcript_30166/g.68132 Transcript_30166/m.68132 type:complete len:229 (-) Transcript_30166:267-953(-)
MRLAVRPNGRVEGCEFTLITPSSWRLTALAISVRLTAFAARRASALASSCVFLRRDARLFRAPSPFLPFGNVSSTDRSCRVGWSSTGAAGSVASAPDAGTSCGSTPCQSSSSTPWAAAKCTRAAARAVRSSSSSKLAKEVAKHCAPPLSQSLSPPLSPSPSLELSDSAYRGADRRNLARSTASRARALGERANSACTGCLAAPRGVNVDWTMAAKATSEYPRGVYTSE